MKNRILFGLALVAMITGSAFSQTYVTQVKPAGGKLWGYANLQGELIIPAQFDKCYKFSGDGYAPIYDSQNKKYYFINIKGEKLATDISDYRLIALFSLDPEGFTSGMVPVRVGDKWGYLSKSGKMEVQAKYQHVSEFNGGYAVASNGSTSYIIDANGQESKVELPGMVDLNRFSEKLAPYKTEDKQVGFVDVHGKVAIPAKFESVGYFVNRMAWAKSGGQLGYINPKGEWVIKPQFQAGKDFDAESGLARIKTGDKWAYVTMTGEIVNMNDTDLWGDFSEGLADGRKGNLKGFFNNKGEWAIKPQFEGVREFKNGYAAAKQGGKWGMIDKKGNWVIKPSFDGIRDMEIVN